MIFSLAACGFSYNNNAPLIKRIEELERELENLRNQEGIKGDKGEIGEKGDEGAAGLSAYEIYKKYYSYTGTENEWIDDLVEGNLQLPDKKSPEITYIDESIIPTAIGLKSKEVFYLPFPTVADNRTPSDEIHLRITIVNPNNRTIGSWDGKIKEFGTDNGIKISDPYLDYFKPEYRNSLYFNSSAISFSFDWIDFTNARLNHEKEQFGVWTITYSIRDEANNGGSGNARRSYVIDVY